MYILCAPRRHALISGGNTPLVGIYLKVATSLARLYGGTMCGPIGKAGIVAMWFV
jgi:hypothetical protein